MRQQELRTDGTSIVGDMLWGSDVDSVDSAVAAASDQTVGVNVWVRGSRRVFADCELGPSRMYQHRTQAVMG